MIRFRAVLGAFALAAALDASAANDPLGVRMLDESAAGGEDGGWEWSNGVDRTFGGGAADPYDPCFRGRGDAFYTPDGQGCFNVSGPVPRMYIHDPALRS